MRLSGVTCHSGKIARYLDGEGVELLRKLRKLGRRRNVKVALSHSRGKGSHAIVKFGNQATTIPDIQRELKTGTLHAILKELGLSMDDLP